MKTYVYTCRNKDGTLKRGQLEASDRADALRQLKGQGRLPLSLSEGTSAAHPGKQKRLVAAVAATALVAVLASFVFVRFSAKPVSKPDVHKPETANATNRNPVSQKASPRAPSRTAEPNDPDGAHTGESASPSVRGAGNTFQDDTGEMPAVAEAEKPDTTLRTQTEKMLSLMASLPPGAEIPPMPLLPGMEKDFAVALTNVIVIHTEDTDEMADRKEKIAWLKQDIAALVQEGSSPGEAIKLIEENTNRIAKMRTEFLQYATALYREGKEDEAMLFIAEANKELTPYGAEPIQLSPRLTRAREAK